MVDYRIEFAPHVLMEVSNTKHKKLLQWNGAVYITS
jgi:hypothetical protein